MTSTTESEKPGARVADATHCSFPPAALEVEVEHNLSVREDPAVRNNRSRGGGIRDHLIELDDLTGRSSASCPRGRRRRL